MSNDKETQSIEILRFTPGPWHYSGCGEVINREEREFVCNTKWEGPNGTQFIRNARWDANANLIAAAPDLYQALAVAEELRSHKEACPYPYGRGCDRCAELTTLSVNLRISALAKARGEGQDA